MKKNIFGVGIAALILIVILASLPIIPNSDPSFQTDLRQRDLLNAETKARLKTDNVSDFEHSVMILHKGEVVFEDGPSDKIMNTHSTRKAIMSLIYGIAVDKGLIDLDKTLAELNIDEVTPLTDQEKSATIRDLLMSRSGIYLPAQGEHDEQVTDRPRRGQHKPGEYFFNNNFDFNALGTIFVQETGISIGEFMEENLAKPLGMQDFSAANVPVGNPWYFPGEDSLHDMYRIYMSTRDFARIAAMVADGGIWEGQQVVPASWIKESTANHSDLSKSAIKYDRYEYFGYAWWIDQDTGIIWNVGIGGHIMMIDPKQQLALVERNFTGNSQLSTALWLIGSRSDRGQDYIIKAHGVISDALSGTIH
ncbi:serine hydrolase domain-containing protein [Lentilitoribacter sp. EG35]|uniref:serine hydrolase domain-containing protein n=1 Tax=Lentilitoribacter sp. EG35 TaxID=3234192 RepID=UPI00345FCF92